MHAYTHIRRFLLLAIMLFALPAGAQAAMVNINTADAALLDTLPGIGPVLAERIISYREANGPFSAIADIQNVSGIGPGSTYAKIEPLITVGDTGAPDVSIPDTSSQSSDTSHSNTSDTTDGSEEENTSTQTPSANISVNAGPDTTAFIHVPCVLRASVKTKSGATDPAARVRWNFGDGSSTEGRVVEKTYRYAGTYLVTASASASDGQATAQDDLTVTVQPAEARIAVVSGEGVTIANDAGERLDLSGWRVATGGGSFRMPEGTVILPNARVLFPYPIMNLPPALTATLAYPSGVIAARYEPAPPPAEEPTIGALAPIPGEEPLLVQASYKEVQAVDQIINADIEAHEEAVGAPRETDEDSVSRGAAMPFGAPGPASPEGANTGGFFRSPWAYGLIGILALAGGAFIFL